MSATHTHDVPPSRWVTRWARHAAPGSRVLDVACGGGRHALYFAERGHPVDAVDRDADAVGALSGIDRVRAVLADIESGPWPFEPGIYGAVVVINYLHRPLFPHLLAALAPGGVLIYETFSAGNERFGRPSNPAFLLQPGELMDRVRPSLKVLGYEDIEVGEPRPAMIQRVCAVRLPVGE